MSVMAEEQLAPDSVATRVNNFNIKVATVNGSGSQTSNNVLIRSLFKMGIPTNGKNLFPSNIQGLPTWYEVRLSADGYLGRRDGVEIAVCMNPASVAEDMQEVRPGGIILYDEDLPIAAHRNDVRYFPMPVKWMLKEADIGAKLRDYVANMVYVGFLAYLLGIDLNEIRSALDWGFGGKEKAVTLNFDMITRAFSWAEENVVNDQPYRVEAMVGFNENKILIDGNAAAALGALYNGVSFMSWYPITPSSSVAESAMSYGPKLRTDPETGKPTYAIIQAEDELAAIGMVIGAGWAGARAMTATSGPGISLMAEFVGLAYFAEIPAVIWDIQRMGPSTGLPTRTSQGDILAAYYLSHGDTRHVVLFPSSPAECFEFAGTAFDLAEGLQTPVFVLSDLDLGMNYWISDRFEYPTQEMKRGKVLDADQVKELGGKWGRYLDTDGDGIPYRTLPGNSSPLASYFSRGTGHNEYAIYSERPEDWEANLERISRKFETARSMVPAPIINEVDEATVGIISLGSNDPAVQEARDILLGQGIKTSYLRVRALPFTETTLAFVEQYDQIFVVENNFDGQLQKILVNAAPAQAPKFAKITKCDGLPLAAKWIAESIMAHLA
ncbi:MAG: 2-oxoacid:acceptor oxidoreductase subunit alpha [Caldilineaceae bacterium]|jgi:2-oxoglutarate ferredoxin oxidoreductase subunit alpha